MGTGMGPGTGLELGMDHANDHPAYFGAVECTSRPQQKILCCVCSSALRTGVVLCLKFASKIAAQLDCNHPSSVTISNADIRREYCAKGRRAPHPSPVVFEEGRDLSGRTQAKGASIVQQLSRGQGSNFLEKLFGLVAPGSLVSLLYGKLLHKRAYSPKLCGVCISFASDLGAISAHF